MSETPVDTSSAHIDGEEPSMEDILASIRRIIADDQPQTLDLDETDLGDDALDLSIEAVEAHERKMEELELSSMKNTLTIADISESTADIFEPSAVENTEPVNVEDIIDDNLETIEVPDDVAGPDAVVGLDEQLDLVVDAEATKFVEMDVLLEKSPNVEDAAEADEALSEDELIVDADDAIEKIYSNFQDMEIEQDTKSHELSEHVPDMDSSTEDLMALLQPPEDVEDLDIPEQDVSDIAAETVAEVDELDADTDIAAATYDAAGDEFIDFEMDLPLQDTEAHDLGAAAKNLDAENELPLRASQEDDIDLVKALLADLMEDEVEEGTGDTQGDNAEALESSDVMDLVTNIDDTDMISDEQSMSVFDDILDTSVAAQEDVQADALQDEISEEGFSDDTLANIFAEDIEGSISENISENVDGDEFAQSPEEATNESELAKIARLASEAAQNIQKNMVHTQEDEGVDDLVLPDADLTSRLHLMSSLSTGNVHKPTVDMEIADRETVEMEEVVRDIEDVSEPVSEDMDGLSEMMSTEAADDLEKITALLVEDGEDILQENTVFAPEDNVDENSEHNDLDSQENIEPIKEEVMAKAAKKDAIMSEETEQDAGNAFASLSSAVQEKTQAEESGPPIGDLVQEALRPMLQEWLDKHLKGIVERAVTKEVKRIASGK